MSRPQNPPQRHLQRLVWGGWTASCVVTCLILPILLYFNLLPLDSPWWHPLIGGLFLLPLLPVFVALDAAYNWWTRSVERRASHSDAT